MSQQYVVNAKEIERAQAREAARQRDLAAAQQKLTESLATPIYQTAERIQKEQGDAASRKLINIITTSDTYKQTVSSIQQAQSQIDSLGTPIDIPAAIYGTMQSSSSSEGALLSLIEQLQKQFELMNKQAEQAKINAQAEAEKIERQRAENAIAVLTDRFNKYGLGSLVSKIRELAISGATESTITLQLQETEEYKERFKANQERIKKGLTVLSPGEYLGLEDSYRQVLRAYGLKNFDTDAYVSQFIANDVSTAELSSRVSTAVQRVQNANPAVLATLRDYYGIGNTDLVGYVLDPEREFPKIERQVAAAEIGAAAGLQGIQPGVAVAEQLAAQGITQAQAQKGYATIADILPTSEKLSQIYTGVLDQYGLAEAEQEVFNSLASAQRKRRALTEREIASFSGASGLGKTSLTRQVGGAI